MKKVLVLTRFRGEYEPTRIKKEALLLGYEVDLVNYEQIRIGVSDEGKPVIDLGTGKKLDEYNIVIPRAASARGKQSMVGVKTIVLEYLENLNARNEIAADGLRLPRFGIPKLAMTIRNDGGENKDDLNRLPHEYIRNDGIRVLNGESFKLFPLMGKMEQGVLLAQSGLPVIPFSSFNGKKGWKSYLEGEHKLPVMVKMRFGSHGKNVKLAETEERLVKLSNIYTEGTVLIQPVMKVRRWYRVIVLNGKVLGMMKHKQKGKFQTEDQKEELANVKPSFTDEQVKRLGEISLKACELFKCDYAGLDIAWDEEKKDWVIFEVNRTAQFKWFERAYPEINVAREIVSL